MLRASPYAKRSLPLVKSGGDDDKAAPPARAAAPRRPSRGASSAARSYGSVHAPTLPDYGAPAPGERRLRTSARAATPGPGCPAAGRPPAAKGGAGASASRYGARVGAAPAERPKHRGTLVGLTNLGNTCFLNAPLQCLLGVAPLVEVFLDGSYAAMVNGASPSKGAIAHAFAELVRDVYAAEPHSAVSPAKLKRVIGQHAPQFQGHSQHDCQELFRYLLDGLAEDLKLPPPPPPRAPEPGPETEDDEPAADDAGESSWAAYRRNNRSLVTDTFCGQLRSSVECCSCHHVSTCFDPYLDISLPIPAAAAGGNEAGPDGRPRNAAGKGNPRGARSRLPNACTLEECLETFTEPEVLEGGNKVTCERCGKLRKCVKWLTIHSWPKILVLHVKRFAYTSVRREKLATLVTFPVKGLDLGNFISKERDGAAVKPVYDLFATSDHLGDRETSGHYVANCAVGDAWHQFNDARASRR
ncbi:ubiquitinyl hydrolase [Aureococcus anophagefferens]|nr:ubiquitinyl hydrolase [Aureococcus anophagefferens]